MEQICQTLKHLQKVCPINLRISNLTQNIFAENITQI
jgi:hypothetical protein